MPVTAAQSKSQRQRWEGGLYRLLFSLAPRLLAESLKTRSRILRDRAIEMFIPPFAEMLALPVLFLGLTWLAGRAFGLRSAPYFMVLWALILALQLYSVTLSSSTFCFLTTSLLSEFHSSYCYTSANIFLEAILLIFCFSIQIPREKSFLDSILFIYSSSFRIY